MKNGDATNNQNACRYGRKNRNQQKGNACQNERQHEIQSRKVGS
jgi:hypothetical protein